MRIVSGKYGGRRLITPKNNAIRPTSDKVRQAIFNSLQSRGVVQDATVIDAFCGSGALGIEALSQWAAHCLFIDKNASSLNLTKENVSMVGAENESDFLMSDSTKLIARSDKFKPASLVFLDPPYNQNMISSTIEKLIEGNWLLPSCFFVIETDKS
ncbi:MAG: 16S rRNA (guanine(966)-N(2))-methyltransferase RsmD [Pseudomonadota bacterium]